MSFKFKMLTWKFRITSLLISMILTPSDGVGIVVVLQCIGSRLKRTHTWNKDIGMYYILKKKLTDLVQNSAKVHPISEVHPEVILDRQKIAQKL